MEFQQLIEARKSIRKFTDAEVKNEDIVKMIEAASIAPSAKNLQNWHFVVIKRDDIKAKLAAALAEKNSEIAEKMKAVSEEKAMRFQKFCKNFTMFAFNAPAVVVVMSCQYIPSGYDEIRLYEPENELHDLIGKRNPGMQSIGAGVEHFYLKAVELGYSMCWLTSANYAAEEIEEILREEGIFDNKDYFMVATLALGVADGEGRSPAKKAADEIYTLVE